MKKTTSCKTPPKNEKQWKRFKKTVFDANPDGIFWADGKGRILSANRSFCEMMGYTEKELLSLTGFDIDEELQPDSERLLAALDKDEVTRATTTYVCKDGRRRPVSVTVMVTGPRKKKSRKDLRVCCIVHDLSVHHEMEAALRAEIENSAEVRLELEKRNQELEELASIDDLTGAWSRRIFFEAARNAVEEAKRYGADLSLIMIDIDKFKRVNDDFGHLAGDAVLTKLVAIIKGSMRKVDSLVRWGGEEFVVLLPHTEACGATVFAERIRALVERSDFEIGRPVTVSIGVSGFQEQDDIDSLLERADQAMYRAKNAGRNRVEGPIEASAASHREKADDQTERAMDSTGSAPCDERIPRQRPSARG